MISSVKCRPRNSAARLETIELHANRSSAPICNTAFLREVGNRLREIHVRSARNKLWLEDLEDSDIDYGKVAEYLRHQGLAPLIVVELAYRSNTTVTRPLKEDLRLSRMYAQRIFGIKADA